MFRSIIEHLSESSVDFVVYTAANCSKDDYFRHIWKLQWHVILSQDGRWEDSNQRIGYMLVCKLPRTPLQPQSNQGDPVFLSAWLVSYESCIHNNDRKIQSISPKKCPHVVTNVCPIFKRNPFLEYGPITRGWSWRHHCWTKPLNFTQHVSDCS